MTFEIISYYRKTEGPESPWETIDETDSFEEAQFMQAEYRLAFGPEFYIYIRECK